MTNLDTSICLIGHSENHHPISMTVHCNCPKLFSLLTDASERKKNAPPFEQRKLDQRVSELMAADSLDELIHHKSNGLTINIQPPNLTFAMNLDTHTQLIFSASQPDDRVTTKSSSWSFVKSVNLIRIER